MFSFGFPYMQHYHESEWLRAKEAIKVDDIAVLREIDIESLDARPADGDYPPLLLFAVRCFVSNY